LRTTNCEMFINFMWRYVDMALRGYNQDHEHECTVRDWELGIAHRNLRRRCPLH
jgi:hypothetical protein